MQGTTKNGISNSAILALLFRRAILKANQFGLMPFTLLEDPKGNSGV
jgi:hypothetical protein